MSAQAEGSDNMASQCITAIQGLLGDRLSTNPEICLRHGRDESFHTPVAPDAVAFARSTQEVSEIVKICAAHKTPVIPFGTGTSLEGHVAALRGGISIDVSGMNQIIRVNAEDMDCTVQPGVTRNQLNTYLHDTGLFFPIDPGADASLGGMTATRASGTNAVRYGTMRENVIALTVVLADGRIVQTSQRSRKSAAGYDLTRLFVGSEGTLGVITEVTLRLYGIPEAKSAAVCSFETMEGAVNAVIETLQTGLPMSRIELVDELSITAINAYSNLDYPEAPTLFLEFTGTPGSIKEQIAQFREIAQGHDTRGFQWAEKTEDINALWKARHDAYYAIMALRPGCKGFATDVCVPISRLAECILETRKDIEASSLLAPIVGHVGDGNFHVSFVIDPDQPDELAEANRINDKMVARAIAMEGTCTGEHGIGYGKIRFLEDELPSAVPVMKMVKRALDPDNIMNPGKVLSMN